MLDSTLSEYDCLPSGPAHRDRTAWEIPVTVRTMDERLDNHDLNTLTEKTPSGLARESSKETR